MDTRMKDTIVIDAFLQALGKEHPEEGLIIHTQFKVDDVTCIDRESGEKKDFDVSIEDSTVIIDGKKFLDDLEFYNHVYEFIVTGSYTEGKLNHFETVPGEDNYVNIPNILGLVVSNVDETDRILKTNEVKAPVRLIAGDVTVKYLEESTKQPITDDVILKGELDQEYQTEAKEVGEYTLKTTPNQCERNLSKTRPRGSVFVC